MIYMARTNCLRLVGWSSPCRAINERIGCRVLRGSTLGFNPGQMLIGTPAIPDSDKHCPIPWCRQS